MNVLCVSAHPDDELLGVGGTLARHAASGDRVVLAILSEGTSLKYPDRVAEVRQQSHRAAEILGAAKVVFGDLPDMRLDTVPLIQIAALVERFVAEHQPERVYTHFAGDMNRDHRQVAEATLVATRPYATSSVREVLMFETPSSTEWATPHQLPPFQPSVFVDVSSTLETKIRAFLCYTAEVRPAPHPRSPESLRARAQHWGSVVGCSAAEPFALVRSVR